jgi:hypothetical protein
VESALAHRAHLTPEACAPCMFSLWFVNKQFINARVVQQHFARTGMNQGGNVRIRKSLTHGSKKRRH